MPQEATWRKTKRNIDEKASSEISYINVSFVLKYIIVRPEKGRTALYRSFFGYTYI